MHTCALVSLVCHQRLSFMCVFSYFGSYLILKLLKILPALPVTCFKIFFEHQALFIYNAFSKSHLMIACVLEILIFSWSLFIRMSTACKVAFPFSSHPLRLLLVLLLRYRLLRSISTPPLYLKLHHIVLQNIPWSSSQYRTLLIV